MAFRRHVFRVMAAAIGRVFMFAIGDRRVGRRAVVGLVCAAAVAAFRCRCHGESSLIRLLRSSPSARQRIGGASRRSIRLPSGMAVARHAEPIDRAQRAGVARSSGAASTLNISSCSGAWLILGVSQGRIYRSADARIPSAAKVSTGFLPVALVADEAQSCFQPVYVVGCFSCGAIYAAAVIPEPLFEFV